MTLKRFWQTMRLWSMKSSVARVKYLKKHRVFMDIGENVTFMDRKIPLYAKLIRIHNNVRIASSVSFVTHDVTHFMLNKMPEYSEKNFGEIVGCIELMDNVFIGTNCTILSNVRIGPNAIVAAGAVVTKDVPPDSVVAGVPAKRICSFQEYVERRQTNYPDIIKPEKQEVSEELVNYLWKDFEEQRKRGLE